MTDNPWTRLGELVDERPSTDWLSDMLKRNAGASYLKRYGSPLTRDSFRESIPLCDYDDFLPSIERLRKGECDVLFSGQAVAYERTGGSSGGVKLIPYSREGLLDFQRSIVPWLARTARAYGITGQAYCSISPATRKPERIGDIPIGLPDIAYLGEQAGFVMAQQSAVPLALGKLRDVALWRAETIKHLTVARDLELISVWSPTFLLRLLEDIPHPQRCWPRLKVISCWASGSAQRYADQLKLILPHATLQPKGLLSTEAIVTVPDASGKPVLAKYGFVEFAKGGDLFLEEELKPWDEYEVVITTASGLYRYKTGDRVRFEGRNELGRAILEFIGRGSLSCDLVGEKLTEAFVSKCLEGFSGFTLLVPDASAPGYILISTQAVAPARLAQLENALGANPQYAYAQKLGQLAPLRFLLQPKAFQILEQTMGDRGARVGDVKPLALRGEAFWLPLFEKGPS